MIKNYGVSTEFGYSGRCFGRCKSILSVEEDKRSLGAGGTVVVSSGLSL